MTSERSCPACGGSSFAPAFDALEMFDGESFGLSRCAGCGLLRTDDALTEAELAHYYHYDGGADAGARFVGLLEPLMRSLRRARFGEVMRVHPLPGRVLDVGCGRGVMLAALQDRGWEVHGTEVDESVAQSAKARLGDRIQTGEVQDLDFPAAPFDVVTFWHVLEHLRDPLAALRKVAGLLTPGGAVIIAVPNLDSWQARFSGRHWLQLDVPRHRWHFSSETLARLAERVGLRIERVQHFSWEFGPYGVLQSALARAGLGHFLFTDILRPTREGRLALLGSPRFWAHVALAAPIAVTAAASLPVELLAAARHAGGAITVTLR